MGRDITREALKEKMDRGDDFVLVDALSHQHYESSHLPGAVNLPYELVDKAETMLPDRQTEIVVYCMGLDCATSKEEASELGKMGYENVRHYVGGKQDWLQAGLPVEGRHGTHTRISPA
ncbi:MAG: rhodanese-like domain-containing protein [Rubrobacter sp.]|nr:rhodanese-like domain-containing protein [Rubrobacter sp.]